MGRTKYSPEARNAIMAAFVKAAKETIETEGIEATSIRNVSTCAGYSSATLYLYFEDMSELVTMSLISRLGDYTRDAIVDMKDSDTPKEAYVRSWRLFCQHAFAHPSTFSNLFFGPQANNLDTIAQKYYELFPEELERASGYMFEMLSRGDLRKRNRVLLERFAYDLGFDDAEVDLANELTVSFFHTFLDRASERDLSAEEIGQFAESFIEGALFLLRPIQK